MNRKTAIQTSAALVGALLVGKTMFLKKAEAKPSEHFTVMHTDAEWQSRLTPEQYATLRQHATEAPWSSPLEKEERAGTYSCAGCDLALFSSATKYHSGTGWPSFWQPLANAVGTKQDYEIGLPRTEVHCHRCGGHLGHLFDDGPKPTGLRYCMNGVALEFRPKS